MLFRSYCNSSCIQIYYKCVQLISVRKGVIWLEKKQIESVILDFKEKAVSKIAFARTKEEAERIERQLNMHIYYPSELANLQTKEPIFVLMDC